jgi:hypothetical protein
MTIEIKTIRNKKNTHYFDNGNDYCYSPIVDGKEYSHVAETEDMALIIGLAIKYDGLNSQFPKMAARMLGIKSQWAM